MDKKGTYTFTTIVSEDLASNEAQALMRAIIEETPLVIYAKDLEQRFLLSNRQHASLIGLAPTEILGRTDEELFGEEAEELEVLTQSVIAERRPFAQEFQLTLQDQPHTFLETIFPLLDSEGAVLGLGGIAADITERRALESALRERATELEIALQDLEATQAELVQQQKLAALGRLVAGLAHEVNTPLGAALTASTYFDQIIDELEQGFKTGRLTRRSMLSAIETLRETTQLTVSNLKRSAHLLQSFQRIAVNQTQTTTQDGSLLEWSEDFLFSLSPLMRQHHIHVHSEIEARHPVRFAAGDLQQVLTNLLINASLHAFEPLPPDVASRWPTTPEIWEDRRVDLKIQAKPEGVHICVEDCGVGIPEEFVAHIFDPFFTTRRARGGTGLGLSIVYSIVTETFGGTIQLQTRLGEGTRFIMNLPWCEESLWPLPRAGSADP